MTDFLKTVDIWFLVLAVFLLGGWFVYSVKGIFLDFKQTVLDLRSLIGRLFDKHDDHENRISTLEGRCEAMHVTQQHGGRREYDPPVRMT